MGSQENCRLIGWERSPLPGGLFFTWQVPILEIGMFDLPAKHGGRMMVFDGFPSRRGEYGIP
jgi:hypothetical protein